MGIIDITIDDQSDALQAAAFGTIAVFSADVPVDNTFTQGTFRTYTGTSTEILTSVGEDFGTGTNTYKLVTKMLSQENKPDTVKIFAREDLVAGEKTITFSADLSASNVVTGSVNGYALTSTTYATSHAATMAVIEGKIEAIPGISGAVVAGDVITVTGSDEYTLDISDWAVTGGTAKTVTIATSTAAVTVADDFATAVEADSDFYWVLETTNNAGAIKALAAVVEAADLKMFSYTTSDANSITSSVLALAYALKAASYRKTFGTWHHLAGTEFAGAAIVGRQAPLEPGVSVFFAKSLSGVTVTPKSSLSTTQLGYAEGNNLNTYITRYGVGWYAHGTTAAGTYIDNEVAKDKIKNSVLVAVGTLFISREKLGFTDPYIQLAVKTIEDALIALSDPEVGIIVRDSISVTAPRADAVLTSDRANRLLPDITVVCQGQGAIQNVDIRISFEI